jgi:dephospho-CoA kinase
MPYTNLVIGLTGGIGSGKSTVATLFARFGITIIDTDIIARELTEVDTAVYQQILDKFGADIAVENKKLDRKALRKLIFSNSSHRLWLENLLHPLIRDEMLRQVEQSLSAYTIAVIPLLLESNKPNPVINRILVVDTAEAIQIQRTKTRDFHTAAEVENIMNAQIKRAARLTLADDIIVNDGLLADLEPQVEKLHQFYLSLCETSPSSG